MARPAKILFLASNPRETDRLRLDEEVRSIDEALRKAEFRDQFEIVQHWAVRGRDLQECLLRHQPDIVHFSGHGSGPNGIILEAEDGSSHPVATRALHRIFELLKDNVRCVVFNACYSEVQAVAIAEHVDGVVGMSQAIGDEAAIAFAAAFYQGLGYGRDLKTAFELGCSLIDLKSLNEQDTPKLHTREGIDPQKIFFARHEPEIPSASPATFFSSKRCDFFQHIHLPPNYVPREELLAELRAALLSSNNALALTSAKVKPTALHGMGGIGKSVMARVLCEEEHVQAAFPHGILWTTLGQEPNLAEKLREWIHALNGVISENAPTLDQLKNNLNKLLEGRQCLLVVDDVWRKAHAETFRVGSACRLLLTTRDAEVAAELGAMVQPVPLMAREEAVRLLEEWAHGNLQTVESAFKERIVERLGRLPLALRLAGAQLRAREPQAWLAAFEVHQLKAKRIEGMHDSLAKTFALSLEALGETRSLYAALAIFKEDEPIPEPALHKLWTGLANFDAAQTAEFLEDLASRALLTLDSKATPRSASLHDLLRDLIASELNDASRRHAHTCLLEAYRATCTGPGWHTAPDDGYLYDHLVYHLQNTQQWEAVHALFKDQNWMNVRVPQRDYDYDGYLSDLMVAWQDAHESAQAQIAAHEMPLALADCVRYALIRTSVNSLAANYAPELVARAVETGMWSSQRAVSLAAKVPDPEKRTKFFIALLATQRLDSRSRIFVEQQGLLSALAIKRNWKSHNSLRKIVRLVSRENVNHFLQAILQISDEFDRAEGLTALANKLSGEHLSQAFNAALGIKAQGPRHHVLVALALKLSGVYFSQALKAIFESIREWRHADDLIKLAPKLSGENLNQALKAVLEIKSGVARAEALIALVPQLTGEIQEEILLQAFTTAFRIEDERYRTSALSSLASQMSEKSSSLVLDSALVIKNNRRRKKALTVLSLKLLSTGNLSQALAAAFAIKNKSRRAKVLTAIASQLSDKSLSQTLNANLATENRR